MTAQANSGGWEVTAPAQNRRYSGHGLPPARILWLMLPRALAGQPLPENFSWRADSNGWRLENGKTGFVQFLPSASSVAFGSTEFIVLRSRRLCPEYVYLMARSNEFRDNAIKSMTGATGRQRVQTACFDKFLIAQPHSNTLAAFEETVSQLFRNIYVLARKNANLRQTRDLLLPKLISGEVDVEGLDIQVERESYESSREPIPSIS